MPLEGPQSGPPPEAPTWPPGRPRWPRGGTQRMPPRTLEWVPTPATEGEGKAAEVGRRLETHPGGMTRPHCGCAGVQGQLLGGPRQNGKKATEPGHRTTGPDPPTWNPRTKRDQAVWSGIEQDEA
eukprot:1657527-Pyramimonas_sp.AAC.1